MFSHRSVVNGDNDAQWLASPDVVEIELGGGAGRISYLGP